MLSDFLKTELPKTDLAIALKAVREFRAGETQLEYVGFMFSDWYVFEMFQNMLEHLVENAKLDETVLENIAP